MFSVLLAGLLFLIAFGLIVWGCLKNQGGLVIIGAILALATYFCWLIYTITNVTGMIAQHLR